MPERPVIFCVDIDRKVLDKLKQQLEKFFKDEYSVECLLGAESAIKRYTELTQNNVDVPVLIFDRVMPGLKGDEFLNNVQKINPHAKKILLSNAADTEAVVRAFNAGSLFRFMAKPWKPENLRKIVRQGIDSYYHDKKLEQENLEFKEINHNLSLINQELEKSSLLFNKNIPIQFLNLLEADSAANKAVSGQLALSVEKELTVISVIIRDFESFSKLFSNSELLKFLNSYLSQLEPIIRQHNGYIDKFVEGGILALFIEPDEALDAAIALHAKVYLFNEARQKALQDPIDVHIGIDTDKISLAAIGEVSRLQLTILGMPVDTAEETEKKAEEFNAKILITDSTYDRIKHPHKYKFRFTDLARVEGNELVISFYEVLNALSEEEQRKKLQISDIYEKGVIDFRNGLIGEAEAGFERCLNLLPGDVPSRIFLSACRKEGQHLLHKQKSKKTSDQQGPLPTSYLKFWGTRGSSPVSGPEFTRFGGCTCCLELRDRDDMIIFDSGTGSRILGEQLLKEKSRNLHLIFSHFHWDHISGFPFFLPIYQKGFNIDIYAPGDVDAIRQQFDTILSPQFFPVALKNLQSNITFHSLSLEQPVKIGNTTIYSTEAHHPGLTYCFKVETPTLKFGYVTDNEFLRGNYTIPLILNLEDDLYAPYKKQIEFFKGCDLMIHEAQYTPEEYKKKTGWGHSSTDNASVLMKILKPKEWIVTHHDPDESDADLVQKENLIRARVADMRCQVTLAKDGWFRPL